MNNTLHGLPIRDLESLIEPTKWLSSGLYRAVYYYPEQDTVIKKARYIDCVESNKKEVDIWLLLKDTQFAQYLVPVLSHSEDFVYIEMPFCEDIESRTELQGKMLPYNGWDMNRSCNWGIHNGVVKARDYGNWDLNPENLLNPEKWYPYAE